MDIVFIEKLIGLVETSRLTDLEFSAEGQRIRLSRNSPSVSANGNANADIQAAPATRRPPEIVVDAVAPAASSASPAMQQATTHPIVAGLGGTFFTRPAPGEPPFVQVGDLVKEGQVLAIIEAMKMLNSIESDVAGVVTRVCIEDGAAIASGAEMFLIQAD